MNDTPTTRRGGCACLILPHVPGCPAADPTPATRPGPPGFIPILPRSPGIGSAARDLADAERHDALAALLAESESIAGMSYSRLTVRDRQSLAESAARVRIAFGLRKS